ncbi:hypothetical protein ACE60T_003317 [Salmonella enterica]
MGKSYDEQMDGQYVGTMGSVYKDGANKIAGQQWQYATADAKAQRDASVQMIAKNWGVSPETAATLYDGQYCGCCWGYLWDERPEYCNCLSC